VKKGTYLPSRRVVLILFYTDSDVQTRNRRTNEDNLDNDTVSQNNR